ncbi:hypothetical protein HPP92_021546 [Vanilla planifolia]|uniref:Uncharacterized protein n=1 Tax=Vanilla planifolia TaxID=51239 RepID=A0A835Q1C0_VANPL|nr:hypothetical protein HPP92_021546 [Vanilla planifolia]
MPPAVSPLRLLHSPLGCRVSVRKHRREIDAVGREFSVFAGSCEWIPNRLTFAVSPWVERCRRLEEGGGSSRGEWRKRETSGEKVKGREKEKEEMSEEWE